MFGNEHHIETLGPEGHYGMFVAPGLDQFVARRFEDVAAQYLVSRIREGNPDQVIDAGRLWYDDPVAKTNGEFDLVLRHLVGDYSFYEAKYYREPMTKAECDGERRQVERVADLLGVGVRKCGFVAMGGFDLGWRKKCKPRVTLASAISGEGPS